MFQKKKHSSELPEIESLLSSPRGKDFVTSMKYIQHSVSPRKQFKSDLYQKLENTYTLLSPQKPFFSKISPFFTSISAFCVIAGVFVFVYHMQKAPVNFPLQEEAGDISLDTISPLSGTENISETSRTETQKIPAEQENTALQQDISGNMSAKKTNTFSQQKEVHIISKENSIKNDVSSRKIQGQENTNAPKVSEDAKHVSPQIPQDTPQNDTFLETSSLGGNENGEEYLGEQDSMNLKISAPQESFEMPAEAMIFSSLIAPLSFEVWSELCLNASGSILSEENSCVLSPEKICLFEEDRKCIDDFLFEKNKNPDDIYLEFEKK